MYSGIHTYIWEVNYTYEKLIIIGGCLLKIDRVTWKTKKEKPNIMFHDFTNGHVVSTVFELTVLLAQRTWLTAAMNHAIPTKALLQRVLLPHFWTIEAWVAAWTTNYTTYKCVKSSTSTTSCKINHPNTS